MATPTKNPIAVTVSYSVSIDLVYEQVHWTPKGVSLLTKWAFAVGAEVEFAFDHEKERHCCVGVVVGCHPLRQPSGYFETILFFVETPCTKLQKAACDCRLAAEAHRQALEQEMITTPEGANRIAPGKKSAAKSGK